jgi:hypothetical protein
MLAYINVLLGIISFTLFIKQRLELAFTTGKCRGNKTVKAPELILYAPIS